MRMLKDWALALGVGLAVFLIVSVFSRTGGIRSGAAPDFELVNVAGGSVRLSELRGRPVVVNFWGSWCPPCRAEIPELSKFAADNPDVALLGVAVRSGSGSVLAGKAKSLGITYTVLESTPAVLAAWDVNVYPTTWVVDAKGEIGEVFVGGVNSRMLESAVAKLRP